MTMLGSCESCPVVGAGVSGMVCTGFAVWAGGESWAWDGNVVDCAVNAAVERQTKARQAEATRHNAKMPRESAGNEVIAHRRFF
jgi:hypothetical protein